MLAITSRALTVTEPQRHMLLTPGGCECGVLTWARRRGKSRQFSERLTLSSENPAARAAMAASSAPA